MIQSAKNGATSVESLVAQAADDFAEALARGERPHIDAFAANYPEIADQLQRILPAIEAMQCLAADGDAAEVLSDLPAAARELGDFRLIREIGRGGMGVVYEAEQLSLGRTVALKILPFAAMLDARQLARFRNEARAAATLHHNNIVPVHYIGSERGVHFYAMQLIKGDSLARVIEQLRGENGLADEVSRGIHAAEPIGRVLLTLDREDEASRRSVMPTLDEPTTDWVAGSGPNGSPGMPRMPLAGEVCQCPPTGVSAAPPGCPLGPATRPLTSDLRPPKPLPTPSPSPKRSSPPPIRRPTKPTSATSPSWAFKRPRRWTMRTSKA